MIQGKNIVITGATSGIGFELVQILAQHNNILAIGRDEKKLTELKKINSHNIYTFAADLSDRSAIDETVKKILIKFNHIDALFNNAGISIAEKFLDTKEKEIDLLFKINVLSVFYLTKAFIKNIIESKGMIVNIGSLFGDIAHPFYSIYSSSKFAIKGFTESLRREYLHTGIKIFYVAPRATKTPGLEKTMNIGRYFKMNVDEPRVVAEHIINSIEKGILRIYPKTIERIFLFIQKFFPSLIDENLNKRISKI
ncbi:MAG: SDR family NAD(P)-dependent oxidoreductase [Candidatus Fonsibacter sp.]|jgi:short-subunit dehydrogenase